MKLTICQFGKLFLLLTAFFFVAKSFKTLVVIDVAAAATTEYVTPSERVASSITTAVDISSPPNTVDGKQDIERKFEIFAQQVARKSIAKEHIIKVNRPEEDQLLPQLINKTFNFSLHEAKGKLENIISTGNENQTSPITTTTTINAFSTITNLSLNELQQQQYGVNRLLRNLNTTQHQQLVNNGVNQQARNKYVAGTTNDKRSTIISTNVSRQATNKLRSSPATSHVTHLNSLRYDSITSNDLRLLQKQQHKQQQQKRMKSQTLLRSMSSSSPAAADAFSDSSLNPAALPLKFLFNQQPQHPSYHSDQKPFRQHNDFSETVNSSITSFSNTKPPPGAAATHRRVGILVPSRLLNRMHVQQGFQYFVEFFQVNLNNVSVDFIPDDGKF